MRKAPRGSAGGSSGWLFEHAKAACENDDGVDALSIILGRIADGKFGLRSSTAENLHMVSSARFIALNKGKGEIRPVAIGECLRRLAASCMVRAHKQAIEARCLKAKNLAFSSDGCGVATRVISLIIEENPSYLVVENDLSSAYQRGAREDSLFELFEDEDLRAFIPLFQSLYAGESSLFYDSLCVMSSREGSQQGCPLGGLLFILSIASLVEEIAAKYTEVTIVGLADDYRFIGPAQSALDAAAEYADRVTALGHVCRASKSWMWSPSQATLDDAATHPLAVEFREAREQAGVEGDGVAPCNEGLIILGTPVGSDCFVQAVVLKQAHKLDEHLDAIVELSTHDNENATQCAFLLLKWSVSTKFGYLLRNIDPRQIQKAARAVDVKILDCMSRLLHTNRTDIFQILPAEEEEDAFDNAMKKIAATQIFLPTVKGGMGLQSMDLTSSAAYMASWADGLRFLKEHSEVFPSIGVLTTPAILNLSVLPCVLALREAWTSVEKYCEREQGQGGAALHIDGDFELRLIFGENVQSFADLASATPKRQKSLTAALSSYFERALRDDATTSDEVRLTACGGTEANWVTAIPSRPEYRLRNNDWRTALCFRLGVPLQYGWTREKAQECDCHAAFHQRSGELARGDTSSQREANKRRTRNPPPDLDIFGDHDQRCKHAFSLGRHDHVQTQVVKKLKCAGKHVCTATVTDLRTPGSWSDRSQKKADIRVSGLDTHSVNDTLIDFGITHSTIGTNLTNKSMGERARGANRYGKKKQTGYEKTIAQKNINLNYKSFCCESYGAFGMSAWSIINNVCDAHHPHAQLDHNPWNNPGPKRDFYLATAFAIQRGNARMLTQCHTRRNKRQGYSQGRRN